MNMFRAEVCFIHFWTQFISMASSSVAVKIRTVSYFDG